MKILPLCFILTNVIKYHNCELYVENIPDRKYDELRKYVLTSKLIDLLNKNEIPNTRNELPISLKDIPISRNELPISINDLTVSRNEVPISLNAIPISKNDIPISKNDMPISKNEVPIFMNEIPISKNDVPISKNEVPVSWKEIVINDAPVSRNKISLTKNEEPIFKNEIPVSWKEEPSYKLRHVKFYCTDSNSNEVTCNHNNLRYRIKLNAGANRDRREVENIIKSVYENVELKNNELLAESNGNDLMLQPATPNGWLRYGDRKDQKQMVILSKPLMYKPFTTTPSTTTTLSYAASPVIIVLPNQNKNTMEECNGPSTPFPYKVCKMCHERPDQVATPAPSDITSLIIECDPNNFESIMPCCPENQTLSQVKEFTFQHRQPQVYSCRWQGKRDVHPKAVVFAISPLPVTTNNPPTTCFQVEYYESKHVDPLRKRAADNPFRRERLYND